MKIRTFIATASVVTPGSLVAFSGSAQAALYTTRVGDGGAVTVSNDLVVPAGKSCALTGTKVKGTVTVEAGADLVAAGAATSPAAPNEKFVRDIGPRASHIGIWEQDTAPNTLPNPPGSPGAAERSFTALKGLLG
jgi:hypothetical protein